MAEVAELASTSCSRHYSNNSQCQMSNSTCDRNKEIALYPFSPSKPANTIQNTLRELHRNSSDFSICTWEATSPPELTSRGLQEVFQTFATWLQNFIEALSKKRLTGREMDSCAWKVCFHVHISAFRKRCPCSLLVVAEHVLVHWFCRLLCTEWLNGYLHENGIAEHLVLTILYLVQPSGSKTL